MDSGVSLLLQAYKFIIPHFAADCYGFFEILRNIFRREFPGAFCDGLQFVVENAFLV